MSLNSFVSGIRQTASSSYAKAFYPLVVDQTVKKIFTRFVSKHGAGTVGSLAGLVTCFVVKPKSVFKEIMFYFLSKICLSIISSHLNRTKRSTNPINPANGAIVLKAQSPQQQQIQQAALRGERELSVAGNAPGAPIARQDHVSIFENPSSLITTYLVKNIAHVSSRQFWMVARAVGDSIFLNGTFYGIRMASRPEGWCIQIATQRALDLPQEAQASQEAPKIGS